MGAISGTGTDADAAARQPGDRYRRRGPQTTGGNITIDPEFVILQNSQIVANAFAGQGGNIQITAEAFLADPDSRVDASSSWASMAMWTFAPR